PPGPVPVLPSPALPPIAPHVGRPYEVVAAESLVTIRVYRGGTLASAGHNHIIASHTLAGTVYLPGDLLESSFELHLAVAELTVDERELRSQESAADFPPEVPQSAREGTRRNMLGPAVLDADEYPEVVLRAERPGLESRPGAAAGELTACAEAQVRDQRRRIALPLHYELAGDTLIVSGETTLRQSELGLTPFTALMGALAVQDEMRVRFRIVARAADGAR
ncbi:MAG TPA: YceI family protein, partial [Steroidobacteraceae bacterium]|nr:YceI family protein [Steroidobacteraceae bacterium]